jgi:hypothetical protein
LAASKAFYMQQQANLDAKARSATQSSIQRTAAEAKTSPSRSSSIISLDSQAGYLAATKSSKLRTSAELKEPTLSRSSSMSFEQKDVTPRPVAQPSNRKSVAKPLSSAASRPLTAEQRTALVAKRRAATLGTTSKTPIASTPSSSPTSPQAAARPVKKTGSIKNLLEAVKSGKEELLQQLSPTGSKKVVIPPYDLVSGWVNELINQESITKIKNNSIATLLLKYDGGMIASFVGTLKSPSTFIKGALNNFKEILERDPNLNTKKLNLQMIVVEKDNSDVTGKSAKISEYNSPMEQQVEGPTRWFQPMTPEKARDTLTRVYFRTNSVESQRALALFKLLFASTPHA